MSNVTPNPPPPDPRDEMSGLGMWAGPRRSRRDKIREEIEANRRGEYVVPTWVLAVALMLMVGALAALVVYVNQA
jgi:hypothetical protein